MARWNYPHYMATVYRACHTRTEFEPKDRIFTTQIERAHPGATKAARQSRSASVADALGCYPRGVEP
jgi:hypothetical protein